MRVTCVYFRMFSHKGGCSMFGIWQPGCGGSSVRARDVALIHILISLLQLSWSSFVRLAVLGQRESEYSGNKCGCIWNDTDKKLQNDLDYNGWYSRCGKQRTILMVHCPRDLALRNRRRNGVCSLRLPGTTFQNVRYGLNCFWELCQLGNSRWWHCITSIKRTTALHVVRLHSSPNVAFFS